MSYCTEVIKKCDEKPTFLQKCWSAMKSPVTVGLGATAVLGLAATTHQHTPIVVGSGMLAFGAVAASIHQKRKEQEILLRNQKPCTSIFDAYRFQVPPVCYTLPREKPLVFYNNEPKKPEPEDPWMKNIPYDNMPKPNCCKKQPPPADKEAFKSETYGHVPRDGKCPP